MPVKFVFRCQICGCCPGPETQAALEAQVQDVFYGRYVDAGLERWLVWHGRGLLGPMRYACEEHRGDLTAYLRHHYGTLGSQPWKMGPYPRPLIGGGTIKRAQLGRYAGGSGFAI